MAYWNMASPLLKEGADPTVSEETTYARTEPILDTNTIPHHAGVESAEDGERKGRHSFKATSAQ